MVHDNTCVLLVDKSLQAVSIVFYNKRLVANMGLEGFDLVSCLAKVAAILQLHRVRHSQ